ncbi:MAG: extracellular solute-binding protein [Coleofasciculaceae cyanobacterium]
MTLKVLMLQNSIPAQLLVKFRRELKGEAKIDLDLAPQLKVIFERLVLQKKQAEDKKNNQQKRYDFFSLFGRRQTSFADLATLGDYWLAGAIKQELIQPLKVEQIEEWENLPQRWQELVKYDQNGQLDQNNGQVWGAPYRWGSTVIAYRRDKLEPLGLIPTDWQDLWRDELRDRLSLLDQPREVIGLTLKKLGESYNTEDLSKIPKLKEELQALHRQVKFYSSDTYLQPLLLGDTWAAVGWSTDILPIMQRDHRIKAVIPKSGTALWADIWVKPAAIAGGDNGETKGEPTLAEQWINFCSKEKQALEISLLSDAISPILLKYKSADRNKLPKSIINNPLLLPDEAILNNSEFIKPLPETVAQSYQELWEEIRLGKS